MTMSSWADSVPDSNRRPTRSARLNYVPPHLRHFRSGVTVTVDYNTKPSEFAESPYSDSSWSRVAGNDRPYRGRGRGRGRGFIQSGVYEREAFNENFAQNLLLDSNPSDGADADAGINFDAYEDIPVEITGSDIPQPANTFAEIDLGKALNDNIDRCKYVKPTPIQRHAIPCLLSGRDLMACAQTGSGKTAAFCFPIICGILRNKLSANFVKPPPFRGGGSGDRVASPLALILSPTRELTCQIHDEAKKFANQTGLKVVAAYGGAPIGIQFRNLERGVDILVATPGRLVDMFERARISLGMIKYLALDEADRMLDMGFEPQIRKIVEKMDMPRSGVRQTMLFSATFPDEIQRLASDFLSNYIFLSVGRVGSSTDLISQKVEFVEDMDKRKHLVDLLRSQITGGSRGKCSLTLVFVETKRKADALESWLTRNGFPATAIHGDKVQMERERALRSFKNGHTPIMVATDVASRGLDIPHVAHVINFDLPKAIDDYVHRIGRTGRAGKCGAATAFFNDGNLPLAKGLAELMQEANQEVPAWLSECAGRSLSYGGGQGRVNRFRGGGGGRFGGRDYRSGAQSRGEGNYDSNPYGDMGYRDYSAPPVAPIIGGGYYAEAGGDAYVASAYGNGFDNGSIVATGWD